MQQRFVLPKSCGTLQSVSYVNVKPQYQQEVVDGQVVLTGIYLIQVEVARCDGDQPRAADGIIIEEVDLDENVAYFEYGLPLNRKLEGVSPVLDYQMEQIKGAILPNGVLEIQAKENIVRKPEEKKVAAVPDKTVKPQEAVVSVAAPEPVAQIQPEPKVEKVQKHQRATGIVEWLGLSNNYKTEKIQLNPILKQREANRTES